MNIEPRRPALPMLMLVLLALAGCAGTPATSEHQYLLPGASQPAAGERLIVRVRVAGYLDQGGLVLETGATTLNTARHHRWAEPLSDQLERALAHHLSHNDAAGTLTVAVTRFQGTTDGEARVSGDWRYQGKDGQRAGGVFDERHPLREDGYEELVTRLDAAWAAVVMDIQSAILDPAT